MYILYTHSHMHVIDLFFKKRKKKTSNHELTQDEEPVELMR